MKIFLWFSKRLGAIFGLVLAAAYVGAQGDAEGLPQGELPAAPAASVNEVMIAVITPATNALWGAGDPQTEAEWQALDAAALTIIEAFESMKEGGGGPNDMAWAENPSWDAYADETIDAARAARSAIAGENLEALMEAGSILYPPCENCHLEFHPGVIAGQ